MKKLLLIVTVFTMLFLSCTTSVGLIYDESTPLERSSWISTFNLGTITGYNGLTVNWSFLLKTIQIPSGNTLLEVDVRSEVGNTTYTGKGLLFRYDFQPGKVYFFHASKLDGKDGLRVYAYNNGERLNRVITDDIHFVEFVPFLNAQGQTILN
ncbi:MAG: hypothetical protein LBI28_11335 [Treponema sp.]|jgi:hypothetical protein|nr:hypothetical protein [Treponema sp.]